MLDDQYVLALCHLIFDGDDDPEYEALFAVIADTPAPVDEWISLAQQFESTGADPDHASYLAGLVNAHSARPDIVHRLNELDATRVPDPHITHLQALLVEYMRNFALDETPARMGTPHFTRSSMRSSHSTNGGSTSRSTCCLPNQPCGNP